MSNRAATPACHARVLMIIGVVAATCSLMAGCNTSGSDLPSACTSFDRGYGAWQTGPGHEPSRKANTVFLTKLDQAISDAGAAALGSALHATAAGIRELSSATTKKQTARAHHLVILGVTAIRKTCPAP